MKLQLTLAHSAAFVLLLCLAPPARAQSSVGHTELVSVGADATSAYPSLSEGGAFVAFFSLAENLVPGDSNAASDVFVSEVQTGVVTRVSLGPGGVQGDGRSLSPAISADGRFVAFLSSAGNLVANDSNGTRDVFVHDRTTGLTELVSVGLGGMSGNGISGEPHWVPPTISADGRWVAFQSDASDLVPADNNGVRDAFVRDRLSQTTTRVSVDSLGVEGNATSEHTGVSPDGRWVAFQSLATNLDISMPAINRDVYLHDLWTSTTTAITAGVWGHIPRPSWDAEYVTFSSPTPLVANDTNGNWDCFVYERASGTTSRVSIKTGGSQANGVSGASSISDDGRFIAFQSTAADLIQVDNNGAEDVFVHDRITGVTTRVSVGTGGLEANAPSQAGALSPNGRHVGFQSYADNLFPNDVNGAWDVFVHGDGPLGTTYCDPAIPNSTTLPARIEASGLGVAGWRLTLVAFDLPPDQFGYFLAGHRQGYFNPPGSMGYICLSDDIGRFNAPGQVGSSGPAGSFELLIETTDIPVNPPRPVLSGQTWNFQCWYRDTGNNNNFTNAVSVTFQ